MSEIKTVVTKRDAEDVPAVVVKPLSPVRVLLTRVARVYLQSLAGMLTVVMSGMAPDALVTPVDFVGKLSLAGGLALAPATVTLLQNAVELLTRLDESYPQLRA
jgi:hypothetical protein